MQCRNSFKYRGLHANLVFVYILELKSPDVNNFIYNGVYVYIIISFFTFRIIISISIALKVHGYIALKKRADILLVLFPKNLAFDFKTTYTNFQGFRLQ